MEHLMALPQSAEEFRRSHCDRPHSTHNCIGKVTLIPGAIMLDCELCGQANEELRGDMLMLDTAAVLTRIMGGHWDILAETTQRQILLELCRFKRASRREVQHHGNQDER